MSSGRTGQMSDAAKEKGVIGSRVDEVRGSTILAAGCRIPILPSPQTWRLK